MRLYDQRPHSLMSRKGASIGSRRCREMIPCRGTRAEGVFALLIVRPTGGGSELAVQAAGEDRYRPAAGIVRRVHHELIIERQDHAIVHVAEEIPRSRIVVHA